MPNPATSKPKREPFNFTTQRLTALQFDGTRREYKDAEVNGLMLRVGETTKTFSVYRWVASVGKPERVTIGRFPEVGVDAARKRAKIVIGQIAEGLNPAEERRNLRDSDSLADVFESYMANHVRQHSRAKTAQNVQRLFDLHIVPSRLHTRKLSAIALADVQAMHTKIGATMKRTANKAAALIGAVYNYAALNKVQVTNPAKGVKYFKIGSRERFLQPEEMPRFLAALDETPQPYQDLIRLLLFTGVRIGNMLAARFDQFDLANGNWSVPGAEHKNKHQHTVPLPREAVAIVRRRLREVGKATPYLWPSDSASGHLTHLKVQWADLCDRAGVPDLWRHDIRRTVGSWMAIQGESLTVIGKTLGHVSTASTEVYAHLTKGPVREALQRAVQRMNRK